MSNKKVSLLDLLGGPLAGKQNLLYCLGPNPVAEKMCALLDFGSFWEIPRIVAKSTAHPAGVFSMLPNPPKCHIQQKTTKLAIFSHKIKDVLELRLVSELWAKDWHTLQGYVARCQTCPSVTESTEWQDVGK